MIKWFFGSNSWSVFIKLKPGFLKFLLFSFFSLKNPIGHNSCKNRIWQYIHPLVSFRSFCVISFHWNLLQFSLPLNPLQKGRSEVKEIIVKIKWYYKLIESAWFISNRQWIDWIFALFFWVSWNSFYFSSWVIYIWFGCYFFYAVDNYLKIDSVSLVTDRATSMFFFVCLLFRFCMNFVSLFFNYYLRLRLFLIFLK